MFAIKIISILSGVSVHNAQPTLLGMDINVHAVQDMLILTEDALSRVEKTKFSKMENVIAIKNQFQSTKFVNNAPSIHLQASKKLSAIAMMVLNGMKLPKFVQKLSAKIIHSLKQLIQSHHVFAMKDSFYKTHCVSKLVDAHSIQFGVKKNFVVHASIQKNS